MQRWEYRFVNCDYDNVWRPRWVNGEELPNWKGGPSVAVYSNEAGDEGWELVTLSAGVTTDDPYRMVFKRPKLDA